ncbi:MAG: T9SS type A sorting domain-containing protein [Bacteroidetes bacterium]|nr:T9SS type A sorting domain-containing protein [Bacteroidota bacterium]
MKKLYSLAALFLVLPGGESFSQTYSYSPLDTMKYGAIGVEIICSATLINNTANAINLQVTRDQDVMADAPNWYSAFCMDQCYLPATDTVNYTFLPMDTVNFTFHFHPENEVAPDSAVAIMKWKNKAIPSNTFTQRFYGITQTGFGVNEMPAASANVSIYPMPVVSNELFTMSVSNVKQAKTISLVVYNMLGSVVSASDVIAGINFMNLDLPAGIYSYSLVSDNAKLISGKLVVSR